jgi:hypothetical protein
MRKSKIKESTFQGLNFDDLRWCIDNDWQVYLIPLSQDGKGEFKIGVRRNGITTQGKDSILINGRVVVSKELLSEAVFKNYKEAHNHLNYTYKYLRDKYGRS